MRRRIVLAMAVVTAVAMLLMAVPLALAVRGLYRDDAQRQLVDDAAQVAAVVPVPAGGVDPVEIPALPSGAVVGVYSPAGERLAGEGPARGDAAVGGAAAGRVAVTTQGDTLVAALPVGAQEQVVAVVRAEQPLSAADAQAHRAWALMAAVGAGALGVAILVAVLQSRRLSRPLHALAVASERLGHGDFGIRVPPTGLPEAEAAARALEGTARRLDDLLQRERAFAAAASHQLRTPLTALRVRLEGSLASPGGPDRAGLEAALGEAERLSGVIDDLLTLARRDHAAGPAEATDVAAELDSLAPAWHDRLAHRARPLSLELDRGLPPAAISAAALRQVAGVLVENAVDHGLGAVRVTARAVAGGIVVEVADEGPGPDRPGPTPADGAGRRGLGLPLARRLAEAEGARLSSEGPVFRLYLPRGH